MKFYNCSLHSKLFLLLLLFLCAECGLFAQVGTFSNGVGARAASRGATNNSSNLSDSVPNNSDGIVYNRNEESTEKLSQMVFQFPLILRDVKLRQVEHPSIYPTGVQLMNPIHQLNGGYFLDLGGIGLSHLSLVPYEDETFDLLTNLVGLNAIDMQLKNEPNAVYTNLLHHNRFYQTQRPYTLLSYNSSISKDYQMRIVHTQNIKPRWNIAMLYDLVSRDGEYSNSGVNNNVFDLTTNYYSTDARYQLQAGVTRHKLTHQENGGVANDTTCWNTSNRAGVPVNMYSAVNQWKNWEVYLHQSWNTVRQFESYVPKMVHQVDSNRLDTIPTPISSNDSSGFTLRFHEFDTIVGYDTLPMGHTRIFNTGVWGMDFNLKQKKLSFYDSQATSWFYDFATLDSTVYFDSTSHFQTSLDLYWTNDAFMSHRWTNPFVITLGIRPEYNNITYSSLHRNHFFSVNPFARISLSYKHLNLTIRAERSIDGDNDGDQRLDATLSAIAPQGHNFHLSLLTESQTPLELFRFNDGCYKWNITNLDKIYRNKLAFGYLYEHKGSSNMCIKSFSLVSNFTSIKNNVWISDAMLPVQNPDKGYLFQAVAIAQLQKKWLHFTLQEIVQHCTNEDVLRVPLLASKASLYVDLMVFRQSLRLQTGFDVRHHTNFKADGWNPVLGTFYRQNDVEVGNYLLADFWITLQIKRASIYGKITHFNSLLVSNPTYFSLPHYPNEDLGIYWGVVWHFFN